MANNTIRTVASMHVQTNQCWPAMIVSIVSLRVPSLLLLCRKCTFVYNSFWAEHLPDFIKFSRNLTFSWPQIAAFPLESVQTNLQNMSKLHLTSRSVREHCAYFVKSAITCIGWLSVRVYCPIESVANSLNWTISSNVFRNANGTIYVFSTIFQFVHSIHSWTSTIKMVHPPVFHSLGLVL